MCMCLSDSYCGVKGNKLNQIYDNLDPSKTGDTFSRHPNNSALHLDY